MAQAATGAEAALESGFVSVANGVRVLVITAVVRTASLVDEGLRAGVQAASDVFEAAGDSASDVVAATGNLVESVLTAAVDVVQGVSDATVGLVQSAAWSFGGLLHETCEVATFVMRFAAAFQCCYLVYRAAAWAAPRSADRELTDGEAAQRGLSSSASACEAGDGPERSQVLQRLQAVSQFGSPGGAASSADGASSPRGAVARDAVRDACRRGRPAP